MTLVATRAMIETPAGDALSESRLGRNVQPVQILSPISFLLVCSLSACVPPPSTLLPPVARWAPLFVLFLV